MSPVPAERAARPAGESGDNTAGTADGLTHQPNVVAIGGGHGLAASLRAAHRYAGQLTGVVSVADDGGSSGRLREDLGLPAPGDLRHCLAALADDSLLGRSLEHRFEAGPLAGHPLGNLLLVGLAEAGGDFVGAVEEVSRLVGVAGRVLPAAVEPVVLVGHRSSETITGQVAVANARVDTLELRPPDPTTPKDVIAAIEAADQIVLGPGSLFTSVLAAAIVPAVKEALAAATAPVVYVANLRPQPGETTGYDGADHLAALARHGIDVDVVVRHPGALGGADLSVPVIDEPVATDEGTVHDPERLAAVLAPLAADLAGTLHCHDLTN